MKKRAYFLFFGNCVIVKGASRSLLIDLQRYRYKAIPNLLVDIIKDNEVKTLEEIKRDTNHDYDEGIDTYVNFFFRQRLGVYDRKTRILSEAKFRVGFSGAYL